MSKEEHLKELYEEYNRNFHGKEIVLGDGNIDAKIFLIGEAPGKDEVRLSKPFVGAAGKNLNEFLGIVDISRDTIYISNAIKYRLSKQNEQTGRLINRPATKDEIKMNSVYLIKEVGILKPSYVVTLGNVPLKAVTGDMNASIGAVHGQLLEINISDSVYKLFPLYHPASVIYNSGLKDIYIEDIKKLKGIVG